MTLRAEILRLCPRARKEYLDGIESELPYLESLGITSTPRRWQHFFAQIAHESGGLTIREENLSYSAKRMTEVWPGRFPTIAAAAPYAKNPEALANKTYGGRMGNTSPGDGWRYRGRGLMQVTGRNEYRRIGKLIGLDLEADPDAALDGDTAVRAAAAIFADYGCCSLADKDAIQQITKRINGGQTGLSDRKAWLRKAKEMWPNGIAPSKVKAAPEAPEGEREASAPPPVPREPPKPAVVLKQTSRKFRLLDYLKRFFLGGGAGGVLMMNAENITAAQGYIAAVKGFIAAHGVLLLVLAAVGGWLVFEMIQKMQVEDYESGRYQPSGGADAGNP